MKRATISTGDRPCEISSATTSNSSRLSNSRYEATGILALQLFGESVVLFPTTTPAGAGPGNATLTPVVYLYEQGFRRFSQGYASAVAWVLFALIFAFTFLQFQRQREEVG